MAHEVANLKEAVAERDGQLEHVAVLRSEERKESEEKDTELARAKEAAKSAAHVAQDRQEDLAERLKKAIEERDKMAASKRDMMSFLPEMSASAKKISRELTTLRVPQPPDTSQTYL